MDALQPILSPDEMTILVTGAGGALIAVLVSIFKRFVPGIPRGFLPYMGPVVAPLLITLADQVTGMGASPLAIIAMGVVGNGLREMGNWLLRMRAGDFESVGDAIVRKSS